MTSINFKVFGLTRPGFEPAGSGLEPVIFGIPNLPKREVGALLIQPVPIVVLIIMRTLPLLYPNSDCLSGSFFVVFFKNILATCKVISGRVPTCDSANSWRLYTAAPLGNQAINTMT